MEELNKKVVFAAGTEWDIHWMYNVIRAIDGSVYSTNSKVIELCNHLSIKTTGTFAGYTTVIVTNIHLGIREQAHHFLNTGGKAIILQHAWDSALQLCDTFWGHSMDRFTYIFVGSSQDYKWISSKRGVDRVFLTGMPKLDDLHRIKNVDYDLKPIYDELKVSSFYLSIAPTNTISDNISRAYDERLEAESPIPVVFKIHPGGNFKVTKDADTARGKGNRILIDDDIYDIDKTYKVMKASSGVVCVESFFSIEASLLGKPLIFYGHGDIPNNFYQKDENINQIQRAPIEMSSSLKSPQYTDKQKEIASYYLFDGHNTARVVNKLKELL